MGNQVLYPHMQNYAYRDCCMHTGISVCIRVGIAKIFAYGDPCSHNKIVRILGATYTPRSSSMGNSYPEYPPPQLLKYRRYYVGISVYI
jgi:hypothetical protein